MQNDMQDCIQLFLEAFSHYFVFSVQTKPNKTLHLNISRSEQRNHSNAEIRLPYSNFFCHLSSLFQVEVFEVIQHILTSCPGWRIPKCIDMLNTKIEFNPKQE